MRGQARQAGLSFRPFFGRADLRQRGLGSGRGNQNVLRSKLQVTSGQVTYRTYSLDRVPKNRLTLPLYPVGILIL